MRTGCIFVITLLASGCSRKSPDADPQFSDAARFLFASFDSSDAEVAFAMRALEQQIYLGMDVESDATIDRALLPEALQPSDIVGLNDTGGDLSRALPVSLAGLSPFSVEDHRDLQLMVDHTVIEPFSPEYYEREFLEGADCFADRSCGRMNTYNRLIKENALMTVDTEFYKDFRWIDLALPDPSSVRDGETPVNDGEPRWAILGRSWTDQIWPGRGGSVQMLQSYTIEVWIPRDGRGFVRTDDDVNADGGEWTGDSSGGGILRNLTLWAETDLGFGVSDDVVIGTTRNGIDRNFEAADAYLAGE
jgi:hypothetical protein